MSTMSHESKSCTTTVDEVPHVLLSPPLPSFEHCSPITRTWRRPSLLVSNYRKHPSLSLALRPAMGLSLAPSLALSPSPALSLSPNLAPSLRLCPTRHLEEAECAHEQRAPRERCRLVLGDGGCAGVRRRQRHERRLVQQLQQ